MMRDVGCEVASEGRALLGEGPVWDAAAGRLLWVDIEGGRVHWLAPGGGEGVLLERSGQVGGFTLQEDGSLLLFEAEGRVTLWREGGERVVVPGLPGLRGSRFNDVIADASGRVLAGSMPGADGRAVLYRLDLDGSLTCLLDDVGLANGMGFTPDGRHLYFTDTKAGTISRYQYGEDGALGPREEFVSVTEGGFPDGMTVDAEGCLWSARWAGGMVVRYSPEGSAVGRLAVPAENVTSVAFGGPDLMDLYVTTAGGDSPAPAGAVFRARPRVAGRAEFRSRVLL